MTLSIRWLWFWIFEAYWAATVVALVVSREWCREHVWFLAPLLVLFFMTVKVTLRAVPSGGRRQT